MIKGEPGEKGDKGPVGQGIDGPDGDQGLQGKCGEGFNPPSLKGGAALHVDGNTLLSLI